MNRREPRFRCEHPPPRLDALEAIAQRRSLTAQRRVGQWLVTVL
jgi:hypothetical protein